MPVGRMKPYAFLLALIVAMITGGAGVAAFFLQRAGYGPLVWGLLPFLALLVITSCLGVILGRAAASGVPPDAGRPGDPEERPREELRRGDDV